MLHSRKSQIILLLLLLVAAAGVWCWLQRASLKPWDVRVGMATNNVRLSWKTFAYNEEGHFGQKTQFESRQRDPEGGTYSLHCRDGKIYGVEIIYPSGLDKDKSLAAIQRILQKPVAKAIEHDDEELHMQGCNKPSEYFYFDDGGLGAQIDYAGSKDKRVVRIYCWNS